MKRIFPCPVLILSLCLVFVSVASAGELEDKLMNEAINGHADAVRALIEKGANINAKDSDGWTPLMQAAYYGYANVVQVLIERGADVNARDRSGETALNKAEAHHKAEIVSILRAAMSSSVARMKNPRDMLDRYISDLQKTPWDQNLRKQIILFASAMTPPPDIPDEARSAFVQGNTIMKAAKNVDDYNLAIGKYREALNKAPWWGDAYYNLAMAENSAGLTDAAKADLELYVFTKPKDAGQAQNKIYEIEGRQELQRQHEGLCKRFEDEVNQGVEDYRGRRWDAAIEHYKRGLEACPEHPQACTAYCNLGAAYIAKGNLDDGLKYVKKGLELKPDDVNCNGQMADTLWFRGDRPGACKYYKRACDLGAQQACKNYQAWCP